MIPPIINAPILPSRQEQMTLAILALKQLPQTINTSHKSSSSMTHIFHRPSTVKILCLPASLQVLMEDKQKGYSSTTALEHVLFIVRELDPFSLYQSIRTICPLWQSVVLVKVLKSDEGDVLARERRFRRSCPGEIAIYYRIPYVETRSKTLSRVFANFCFDLIYIAWILDVVSERSCEKIWPVYLEAAI